MNLSLLDRWLTKNRLTNNGWLGFRSGFGFGGRFFDRNLFDRCGLGLDDNRCLFRGSDGNFFFFRSLSYGNFGRRKIFYRDFFDGRFSVSSEFFGGLHSRIHFGA